MIIMIEAGPVTAYLRGGLHGGELIDLIPELIAAGLVVVAVCVAATVVPLRLALRRIEMMEW
jgi:hypothetical protein